MADTPGAETASTPKSGTFGFLTRKIGPFPVWVYAAAAVGAYYWYTHYGPGASNSSTPGKAGASTIIVTGGDNDGGGGRRAGGPPPPPKTGGGGGGGGGQWKTITVPAEWNGWTLDKIAKYLHWTPETLQDVQEANARGGKEITSSTVFHTGDEIIRPIGGDTTDTSSSPAETATTAAGPGGTDKNKNVAASGVHTRPAPAGVLGTYTLAGQQAGPGNTVTGWEAAAINYLIGEGVPPDQASTSVWAYQHQEPLSSRMQANINLATDGIGPPPGVPGPAITVKRVKPRNTPRRGVPAGASTG